LDVINASQPPDAQVTLKACLPYTDEGKSILKDLQTSATNQKLAENVVTAFKNCSERGKGELASFLTEGIEVQEALSLFNLPESKRSWLYKNKAKTKRSAFDSTQKSVFQTGNTLKLARASKISAEERQATIQWFLEANPSRSGDTKVIKEFFFFLISACMWYRI